MARVFNTFGDLVGIVVVVFITSVAKPQAAVAESGYEGHGKHAFHHGHHPHVGFGYGGGLYGYHSSTALEGALRGKAAVIDAVGVFRVNDAQAAILREQARALDRENDLAQVAAFHTRLDLARQAREAERARRAAAAAEGKAIKAARQAVVHAAAYQLSPAELNVATGEIAWPAVLGAARFAAERARIEELFARRARYGADEATAVEIGRISEELARALREEISLVPRSEYFAAQRFLLGLKFAANS
jgi:hypothetical protein